MNKTFWTKVLGVIKTYGAIAGAITIISTVAVKVDRQKQKEIKTDKDLKMLMDTSFMFFKSTDEKLLTIDDKITSINEKLNNQENLLKNLKGSYTRYILRDKTLTATEFYEYMKGLEIKSKNKDTMDVNVLIKKIK
jgi:hypothetical protein